MSNYPSILANCLDMEPIRILHISDLLLAAEITSRTAGNHLEWILESIVNKFEDKRIDYLVICGNITKDGSASAYNLAAKQLVTAAKAILKSHGTDLANRIVIAPGECDMKDQDTADPLRNFNNFVTAVRADLGKNGTPSQQLTTDEPVVHFLKDLTFIVAPHWPQRNAGPDIDRLIFDAAKKSDFEFCRIVPAILVSSTLPSRKRARGRILTTNPSPRVNGQLRIGLHFFGSSETFVRVPMPFAERHIGIATGPLKRQKDLALQLNVVELIADEIRPTPHEGTEKIFERRFSLQSYAFDRYGENWLEAQSIRGDSLTLVRHPISNQDLINIHRSLHKELRRWLDQDETQEIHRGLGYLPESGIVEWFEELKKVPRALGEWKVIVHPIPHDGFFHADDLQRGERLDNIVRELCKQLSGNEEKGCRTLVILNDRSYIYHDHAENIQRISELRDKLTSLSFQYVRILYLATPRFTSQDFTYQFRELSIDLADRDQTLNMCTPFDYLCPLRPEAIEEQTGGALGLKLKLLEQFRFEFQRLDGSVYIDHATVDHVLKNALDASAVSVALQKIRDAIQRMEHGPALLQAVSDVLDSMSGPHATCRFILLDGAQKRMADFLCAQGLLYSLKDGRYSVRALAPFSRPYPAEPIYQHINNKIFISVAKEDMDYATGLYNSLRDLGTEVFLFDRSVSPGDEWRTQIEERLLASSVFVPFCSVHFANSEWCREETSFAIQLKHSHTLKIIPILLAPRRDLRGSLLDNYSGLEWASATPKALARAIIESAFSPKTLVQPRTSSEMVVHSSEPIEPALSGGDPSFLTSDVSPVRLMICYANEDRDLVDLFLEIFSPTQIRLRIEIWDDSHLAKKGRPVMPAIHERLKSASMAIFFVSSHSIAAGRYMITTEARILVQRAKDGEAVHLSSIICDPCNWQKTILKDVPVGAGYLKSLKEMDLALRQKKLVKLSTIIEEFIESNRYSRGGSS